MSNCTRCGGIIPNNLISCPVCLVAKNDRAFAEAQAAFLLRVRTGEWSLRVFRDTKGRQHILMFGGADVAFCQTPRTTAAKKIKPMPYDDPALKFVCEDCRTALEKAMETLPV